MDFSKYHKIFLEEAREHLASLQGGFVLLERQPDAVEPVDELFRHAHSLKGMASSMNYQPIAMLSHALEDALGLVKARELSAVREVTDMFLAAVDRLERMVAEVEADNAVRTGGDDLVAGLRGLLAPLSCPSPGLVRTNLAPTGEEGLEELVPEAEDTPAAPVAGPLGAQELTPPVAALVGRLDAAQQTMLGEFLSSGLSPYYLEIRLDPDSPALGARAFIVLSRLAKMGVLAASVPDAETIRRGMSPDRLEALLLYADTSQELRRRLESIPEVRKVSEERIDGALLSAVLSAPAPVKGQAEGKAEELAKKPQTVRVGTDILDNLIDLVGELLISHERLNALVADLEREDVTDELSSLGGLIRHFQETIMEVRMMPLDIVAGRYPRMVRDLSRRQGKEVRFELEGLDIELDRAILEEVGEVLVHLLRNAVDHGMDTPQERSRLGKRPEGLIKFRASRERDMVFIQVSDDGRGFDLDAVRAKALEMKLVTPERLAAMDREEIMLLTTVPGFTTAAEVTDISGRGVGLDAVRTKVESLGGSLSLHSVPGEGTTVTLRLPLSLAIIRVLLVAAGGHIYGLPIARVQHTVEISPDKVRQAGTQYYFKDGGSVVVLRRLRDVLGGTGRLPENGWRGPVVTVARGRRKVGFLVDEVLGARDAVIKPLGQPLMKIPALAGAAITGDGRPMIILDVLRLA